MTSRYAVSINNVQLASVDPSILVTDISYSPVYIKTDSSSVAKRQGSHIYRRYIDKCSVTVSFVIRKYDIEERQAVCSAVAKWASNGGVLRTNDRDSQILQCVCDQIPVINSALRWTDPIQVTFSAYTEPYWKGNLKGITVIASQVSGEYKATTSPNVEGNADGAFFHFTMTPSSGTATYFHITANGRTLNLDGLSVPADQAVKINYDSDMNQRIFHQVPSQGNVSLLSKRTGADDLPSVCGTGNTVTVLSDAPFQVLIQTRGYYY